MHICPSCLPKGSRSNDTATAMSITSAPILVSQKHSPEKDTVPMKKHLILGLGLGKFKLTMVHIPCQVVRLGACLRDRKQSEGAANGQSRGNLSKKTNSIGLGYKLK